MLSSEISLCFACFMLAKCVGWEGCRNLGDIEVVARGVALPGNQC